MNKYVLLGLVLTIVIAGCIGQREVSVAPNRGITINTFVATPSQVRSGELVLFDLEVENIGGTTARNVEVELLGVEDQWRNSFGNLLADTQRRDLRELDPPLLERDIPGDFRLTQWDLMTPNIPQGITPSIDVEARVTYDYNTSGFLMAKAISEDEFRRKQILGESIQQPFEIVNSPGPLHMNLAAVNQRAIIVDTTSNDQFSIHPFRIEIANVGDGFPITEEETGSIRGAGGRLRGTIQLLGPGAEFEDCFGATSGRLLNIDDADITLRVRETGTAILPCTIRIDKDVWNNRPIDSVHFIFNIFYTYFVKETQTISVIGV